MDPQRGRSYKLIKWTDNERVEQVQRGEAWLENPEWNKRGLPRAEPPNRLQKIFQGNAECEVFLEMPGPAPKGSRGYEVLRTGRSLQ